VIDPGQPWNCPRCGKVAGPPGLTRLQLVQKGLWLGAICALLAAFAIAGIAALV
jgi:hypothetical protein